MNDLINKLAVDHNIMANPEDLGAFARAIAAECSGIVRDSHKHGNPMAKMVVKLASAAINKQFKQGVDHGSRYVSQGEALPR